MVRLLQLPPLGIPAASPMSSNAPLDDDSSNVGVGGSATAKEPKTEGLLLRGHTGTIRDLCFPSPPAGAASSASHKGARGRGGDRFVSPSSSPPPPPRRDGVSTAGRLLTVGAGDFGCRLWDVEGGVVAAGGKRGQEAGVEPVLVFRGHTRTVFSCSLLPGGEVRGRGWGSLLRWRLFCFFAVVGVCCGFVVLCFFVLFCFVLFCFVLFCLFFILRRMMAHFPHPALGVYIATA